MKAAEDVPSRSRGTAEPGVSEAEALKRGKEAKSKEVRRAGQSDRRGVEHVWK